MTGMERNFSSLYFIFPSFYCKLPWHAEWTQEWLYSYMDPKLSSANALSFKNGDKSAIFTNKLKKIILPFGEITQSSQVKE